MSGFKPTKLPVKLSSKLKPKGGVKSKKDNKNINKVRDKMEVICEGARNTTLTSYAGSMRRRGASKEEILKELVRLNSERCRPTLEKSELRTIAESIARYSPSSNDVLELSLSDAGNAVKLVDLFGSRIAFVPEHRCWRVYNGKIWIKSDGAELMQMAKQVAERTLSEAALADDLGVQRSIRDHAKRSLAASRIHACVALAASDPRVRVAAALFDDFPYLLPVKNGVLDLATGELLKHNRKFRFTKLAPVKYVKGAKCPKFKKFLKTCVVEDIDLYRYLVTMLGYAITGDTSEQKLFFLHGTGANGKTTLLSVLKQLLGDYLRITPAETIMMKSGGRAATNDIARLEGCRVVVSNEIEEGSFFAESLLKQLTGGDPVAARFLYGEYFEFKPKFKLLIAGNHQPVVRGYDDGIWRRLQLIPFKARIKDSDRDPHLLDKLIKELPGILNLLVTGCREWLAERLQVPGAVRKASEAYRKDMDLIGKWLEEVSVEETGPEWSASDAYASYSEWCKRNGHAPMGSANLGRKLSTKFLKKRKSSGIYYIRR